MEEIVIINGFDRSGTSAISRVIASHPDVELLMQPFNSGVIRRRMYEALDETDTSSEVYQLFRALSDHEIPQSRINSKWFYKHSTTTDFKRGKLHLIKTTINHMAQRWMQEEFPRFDVWGVWRKPKDVVASIINNSFFDEWYKGAVDELAPTVKNTPFLDKYYSKYIQELDSDCKKTSFLLAVRSHFFLRYLDEDKLISYEIFCKNAVQAINPFLSHYNLSPVDQMSENAQRDLNIIGNRKDSVPFQFLREDDQFMDNIFSKIWELKKSKFGGACCND